MRSISMRTTLRLAGLAFFLTVAALPQAGHAFGFWLDAPSRSNPNDPKSDRFQFSYPATPAPASTPTMTPTASPSPTAPGTFTNTPTFSATYTITPSFTASPSSTSTPSPTPTATPTPWLPIYDGENSGYAWFDGSTTLDHGPGAGGSNTASSGADVSGGAEGTANALSYKISGSGLFWAVMVYRPGITLPVDVSAYNTLTLYVKVPSTSTVAACNNFRGAIGLEFNGVSYPNDRSKQVLLSAYVVGANAIGKDNWVKVQIPVTAFLGDNGIGYTVVNGDLANVNGIRLSPVTFNTAGDVVGEIQLDQIGFLNLPTAPAISKLPKVLEDFESPGRSNWDQPPWFLDKFGSVTFTAPAIDSPGNSLSGCYAGHIKGHMSSGWATLLCEFSSPYGTPVDLSNNSVVGQLPATGAKGLAFSFKVTAHNAQVYHIELRRNSTDSPWNQNAVYINEDDYPINTWTRVAIDFPADGVSGGDPGVVHVGWALTELWWGQFDISDPTSYKPWSRTDAYRLHVFPELPAAGPAGDFDFWIDDVEFY